MSKTQNRSQSREFNTLSSRCRDVCSEQFFDMFETGVFQWYFPSWATQDWSSEKDKSFLPQITRKLRVEYELLAKGNKSEISKARR